MEVTPLANIAAKEHRELVMCVRGKVTKVFAYKDGIGRDKDGTCQNLLIEQGKAQVKVVLWDQDEIRPGIKGQEVVIACAKNGKDQWAGVTVEEDEYNGKMEKRLSVKRPATVEFVGQSSAAASTSRPPPPGRSEPPGLRFWVASVEGGEEPHLETKATVQALVNSGTAIHVQLEGDSGGWKTPSDYGFKPEAAAPPPPPKPSAPAAAPQAASVHHGSDQTEHTRAVLAAKHVARHGNAMKICLARSVEVADWFQKRFGRQIPEASLCSMATAFYISLKPDFGRDGNPKTGIIDGLPNDKPIETLLKSLQPDEVAPSQETKENEQHEQESQ